MTSVLFVCTGNICRSPTADGILRAKLADAGLRDTITVDSAGTHGYHIGEPPDPRAIATAAHHGVDLSVLRARKIRRSDFTDFDWVIALDRGHQDILESLAPAETRHKIRLLTSYVPGQPPDVADPYYSDQRAFEQVYAQIDLCVTAMLVELRGGADRAWQSR